MYCNVIILLLFTTCGFAQRLQFDSYSGKLLSEVDRDLNFASLGSRSISTCMIQIQACNPREPRRMDGSCNNMQYPIGGVAVTPYIRMLPYNYGPGNTLSARSSDGAPLPSARFVRNQLFKDGYKNHRELNMMGMQFGGLLMVDCTKILATEISVEVKQYCCTDVGALDPECIPISVPADDPVYGPLGIRCLNVTRIRAFQDYGCSDRSLDRKQINFQTTLLDLSSLYGVNGQAASVIRTRTGGLLRTEERRGRILPATGVMQCPGNKVHLNERVCPMLAERLGAADWRLGSLVYAFYLEHNRLARMLAKLNPCWDNELLFQTARTINIGIQQNIALYEWAPLFFGKQRLLDAGLIHQTDGYVNDYDETLQPGTFTDFIIGMRRMHTIVDGRMEMFSANGTSLGSLRLPDFVARMAPYEYGGIMESINRGSFLQRAAADDMIVDPIVGNDVLSMNERGADVFAFDIQRGRDAGLPPYNDYREECGMPRARTFDDFLDVMDLEQVENLRKVYDNVDDVEMYPGVVSERSLPDSMVGPSLWCIVRRQLEVWRRGDRFWFEGSDHPGSFTPEQLYEVRKTSMARLSCDNIHGIVEVQPQAFLNVMPGNEQIPCSELPSLDISHWKDPTCSADVHVEY